MAFSRNPVSMRYPFELKEQPHEIQQAHRYAFQGLVDLNQAIAALKTQLDAVQTPTTTTGGTGTSTSSTTTVIESILAGLGTVNDQTGNTAYTTQTSDAGALLIVNDASPVAITLNSVVATPFAMFITNFGAGLATLTPTSGLINGGASLGLLQNQTVWVVFDGTNWLTDAIPSDSFSIITSGTNTTAAMVVGSGASLGTSGSGVINASQWQGIVQVGGAPSAGKVLIGVSSSSCGWATFSYAFNLITSGTNTSAAMVMGSGSSLVPSGTGIITATNVISSVIYSAAGTPLPAGVIGQREMVSDATTPAFLSAYVSGGAVVSPVFYNGSAWIIG